MVYLSGSAIAGLLACSLMNANQGLRTGRYGKLVWRGNRAYAALDAVERRTGQRFTAEQLDLVAADHRGRIIIIDEEAAHGGKPSPANRLVAAQKQLAEATVKIGALEAKRNYALLKDRDTEAVAIDAELEQQRALVRAYRDKVQLLEVAAANAETDRRVRERLGLIERIEKRLAERDAAGADLQDLVAKAEAAFRRLIDASEAVACAWGWSAADFTAGLLTGPALQAALATELFRVGAKPRLLGGAQERFQVDFPGGRCADHRLLGLPHELPALTATLAEASGYASAIMRGARTTAGPVAAANGHAAPGTNGAAPAADTSLRDEMTYLPPVEPVPPAVAAEAPSPASLKDKRLPELLQLQSLWALDMSPAGNERYQALVAEIATRQ